MEQSIQKPSENAEKSQKQATKQAKKAENNIIWFLPSIFLVGFLAAWLIRGSFSIDEDVPIKQAHNIIEENFYKEKIDSEQLYYNAIDGMIKSLDDVYSSFYKPQKVRKFDKVTTGKFAGIGVQIKLEDDNHLRILTPMPDSPALLAGIKSGDKILKIDGKDAWFESAEEAVDKLSGAENSEVMMTIERWKTEEIIDVKLVRKIIISPSVVGVKSIVAEGKKIGYMRLTGFQDTTADDFQRELENLINQEKILGLIVDIRYNRGGQLLIVNKIVDCFLPKDKLIVYTAGRNASNNFSYKTADNAIFPDIPVVLLVNEMSASASEILAGALQDHQRAIIVGERTFGKGKVQNIYELDIFDKISKIKLTTALYFTPSGRCIQKNTKQMYCPKCGALFDEVLYPEFEFCPFDKTQLKLYDFGNFYRGGILPDIEIALSAREENFIYVQHHVEEIIGDPPFVTENEQNILDEMLGDKQLQTAINLFKGGIPNSDIFNDKLIASSK